jgi:zinc protease
VSFCHSCFGRRGVAAAGLLGVVLATPLATPAAAMDIERIVSPQGIEAWLVREPVVPLIALDFAFRGGAVQDPDGKAGVANLVSGMLDEGAGELDSRSFQERLQAKAIELSFAATRDFFSGSLRTLVENKDEAANLLRLAVSQPLFDAAALERVRGEVLAGLRR